MSRGLDIPGSSLTSVWLFLAYKDLQTREDIRNAAWHKHGWEELVYYTGNILTGIDVLFFSSYCFLIFHLEANVYFLKIVCCS